MAEILFRLLEESDIDAVNTFYNNFHKAGRTKEKFLWEFGERPGGKGIYILALNGNDGPIIGIQAGIPITFINAEGVEILTVKSEDTLIDVDTCAALGRRDVFNELYSFFTEECRRRSASCIWGFTWVLKSLKRVGCDVPFIVQQQILVLRPYRSYRFISWLNKRNTTNDKVKIMIMVLVSWVKRLQSVIRFFNHQSFTVDENLLGNNELFSEIAQGTNLLFIKQDKEFLNWRIKTNPYTLDYYILNFSDHGKLKAQIISSINPEGQAYIEQMLFAPDLKAAQKRSTIKTVIRKLYGLNACHVRFMLFDRNKINREEGELLSNSGFFKVKPGMGFIFKNIDNIQGVKPDEILFSRLFTQGHT